MSDDTEETGEELNEKEDIDRPLTPKRQVEEEEEIEEPAPKQKRKNGA